MTLAAGMFLFSLSAAGGHVATLSVVGRLTEAAHKRELNRLTN